MYAIIVHRYDPDTVFFMEDDDDNTSLFLTEEEIIKNLKEHPLKRVCEFYNYNLETHETRRLNI